MKKIVACLVVLTMASASRAEMTTQEVFDSLLAKERSAPRSSVKGQETDESVLAPEEEEEVYRSYFSRDKNQRAPRFKFPQTTWRECTDEISGNFTGYKCANSRGISVILKKFIDTHIYTCIDKGLAATGGGVVNELHIVHAGILGDPNHSPRSLHAESRAIDIKSLEMKLTNGKVKNLVYAGTTNRTFYSAFRKCWGEILKKHNGCPYASGVVAQTGTIGWEDKNHQHHMHTSVPYCVNGAYGPYYYQR